MNEELLKMLYEDLGGSKVGEYNEFLTSFRNSEELRKMLWQDLGGDSVGDFKEFERETLGAPKAPEMLQGGAEAAAQAPQMSDILNLSKQVAQKRREQTGVSAAPQQIDQPQTAQDATAVAQTERVQKDRPVMNPQDLLTGSIEEIGRDLMGYETRDYDAIGAGENYTKKLNKYLDQTKKQFDYADEQLTATFGKDWLTQYNEAKGALMSGAESEELQQIVQSIESHPEFERASIAFQADQRGRDEWSEYKKTNEAYTDALNIWQQKQAEVDEWSRTANPAAVMTQNAMHKTSNWINRQFGFLANIPRMAANTVGLENPVTSWFGHISDALTERAPRNVPVTSDITQMPWDNMVEWNDMIVSVDSRTGEVTSFRDKDGYVLTLMNAQELADEFKESPQAKEAKLTFTGVKNLGGFLFDGALDFATTIGLSKVSGGIMKSSALRAGATAAQAQNVAQRAIIPAITVQYAPNFYKAALDQGMNPTEAAQYSILVGSAIGVANTVFPLEAQLAGLTAGNINKLSITAMSKLATLTPQAATKATMQEIGRVIGGAVIKGGGEALEESIFEKIGEYGVNAVFNTHSGSELETTFNVMEMFNDATLGFGVGFLGAGVGHSNNPVAKNALIQAVNDDYNLQRMLPLIADPEAAEALNARVMAVREEFANNESLIKDMDDFTKIELASLLDRRNVTQQELSKNPLNAKGLREDLLDIQKQIDDIISVTPEQRFAEYAKEYAQDNNEYEYYIQNGRYYKQKGDGELVPITEGYYKYVFEEKFANPEEAQQVAENYMASQQPVADPVQQEEAATEQAQTEPVVTQEPEIVKPKPREGTKIDTEVSKMEGRPVIVEGHKGDKVGKVSLDGGMYFIDMADGTSYELGTEAAVGNKSISEVAGDLNVSEETPLGVSESGNVVIRGKEYVNNYSDPTAAINRDGDGNVVSVNLETTDGKKRTFRGQLAEDIAYEITIKQISENNETRQEFEQFIGEQRESGVVDESVEVSTEPTSEQVPTREEGERAEGRRVTTVLPGTQTSQSFQKGEDGEWRKLAKSGEPYKTAIKREAWINHLEQQPDPDTNVSDIQTEVTTTLPGGKEPRTFRKDEDGNWRTIGKNGRVSNLPIRKQEFIDFLNNQLEPTSQEEQISEQQAVPVEPMAEQQRDNQAEIDKINKEREAELGRLPKEEKLSDRKPLKQSFLGTSAKKLESKIGGEIKEGDVVSARYTSVQPGRSAGNKEFTTFDVQNGKLVERGNPAFDVNSDKRKFTDLTVMQAEYVADSKSVEEIHTKYDAKVKALEQESESETTEQETNNVVNNDNSINYKELKKQSDEVRKGTRVFERFSQAEHVGLIEGGRILLESTVLLAGDVRSNEEADTEATRQENLLEAYAKEQGIWVENTTETYGTTEISGEESLVYHNAETGTVTKVQHTNLYGNLQEKLDSITIGNYIFPGARLEIIGYGRDASGEFQVITKQPFIKAHPTKTITDNDIESYMYNIGFTRTDENNYANDQTLIEDLHTGNVILTQEDNIAVIDPVIRLNTPQQGYGGKRGETTTKKTEPKQTKDEKKQVIDQKVEQAETRLKDALKAIVFDQNMHFTPEARIIAQLKAQKEAFSALIDYIGAKIQQGAYNFEAFLADIKSAGIPLTKTNETRQFYVDAIKDLHPTEFETLLGDIENKLEKSEISREEKENVRRAAKEQIALNESTEEAQKSEQIAREGLIPKITTVDKSIQQVWDKATTFVNSLLKNYAYGSSYNPSISSESFVSALLSRNPTMTYEEFKGLYSPLVTRRRFEELQNLKVPVTVQDGAEFSYNGDPLVKVKGEWVRKGTTEPLGNPQMYDNAFVITKGGSKSVMGDLTALLSIIKGVEFDTFVDAFPHLLNFISKQELKSFHDALNTKGLTTRIEALAAKLDIRQEEAQEIIKAVDRARIQEASLEYLKGKPEAKGIDFTSSKFPDRWTGKMDDALTFLKGLGLQTTAKFFSTQEDFDNYVVAAGLDHLKGAKGGAVAVRGKGVQLLFSPKADETTLYHESSHGFYYAVFKENWADNAFMEEKRRLIERAIRSAKDNPMAKAMLIKLSESEQYNQEGSETNNVEFMTELLGRLTDGSIKLTTDLKTKLRNAINIVLNKFGLGRFALKNETGELITFLKLAAQGLRDGKINSLVDAKLYEESFTKYGEAVPSENKAMAQIDDNVSREEIINGLSELIMPYIDDYSIEQIAEMINAHPDVEIGLDAIRQAAQAANIKARTDEKFEARMNNETMRALGGLESLPAHHRRTITEALAIAARSNKSADRLIATLVDEHGNPNPSVPAISFEDQFIIMRETMRRADAMRTAPNEEARLEATRNYVMAASAFKAIGTPIAQMLAMRNSMMRNIALEPEYYINELESHLTRRGLKRTNVGAALRNKIHELVKEIKTAQVMAAQLEEQAEIEYQKAISKYAKEALNSNIPTASEEEIKETNDRLKNNKDGQASVSALSDAEIADIYMRDIERKAIQHGLPTDSIEEVAAKINAELGLNIPVEFVARALAKASGFALKNTQNKLNNQTKIAKEQAKLITKAKGKITKMFDRFAKTQSTHAEMEAFLTELTPILDGIYQHAVALGITSDLTNDILNLNAKALQTLRDADSFETIPGTTKQYMKHAATTKVLNQLQDIIVKLDVARVQTRAQQQLESMRKLNAKDTNPAEYASEYAKINFNFDNRALDPSLIAARDRLSRANAQINAFMQHEKRAMDLQQLTTLTRMLKRGGSFLGSIYKQTRTMAFMMDMSAYGVQGALFMFSLPLYGSMLLAGKNYKGNKSTKAMFSNLASTIRLSINAFVENDYSAADEMYYEMMNDPDNYYRQLAGVELTKPGDLFRQEEMYIDDALLDDIPILGNIISRVKKASESHMSLTLNIMRIKLFDSYLHHSGYTATREDMSRWAQVVNELSGRKTLGRQEASTLGIASNFMAAPRLYWSRAHQPFTLMKAMAASAHLPVGTMSESVGMETLAYYVRAGGMMVAIFELFKEMGYQPTVDTDPLSPDFMKICFEVGNQPRCWQWTGGADMVVKILAGLGMIAYQAPFQTEEYKKTRSFHLMQKPLAYAANEFLIKRKHPGAGLMLGVAQGKDFFNNEYHDDPWISRAWGLSNMIPIFSQTNTEDWIKSNWWKANSTYSKRTIPGVYSLDNITTLTTQFMGANYSDFGGNLIYAPRINQAARTVGTNFASLVSITGDDIAKFAPFIDPENDVYKTWYKSVFKEELAYMMLYDGKGKLRTKSQIEAILRDKSAIKSMRTDAKYSAAKIFYDTYYK